MNCSSGCSGVVLRLLSMGGLLKAKFGLALSSESKLDLLPQEVARIASERTDSRVNMVEAVLTVEPSDMRRGVAFIEGGCWAVGSEGLRLLERNPL